MLEIRGWWRYEGRRLYPDAGKILITADGGGSNGWRLRLWKLELQTWADEIGLALSVCHFPPGTSKWNKIEHRLFSFISSNWRGELRRGCTLRADHPRSPLGGPRANRPHRRPGAPRSAGCTRSPIRASPWSAAACSLASAGSSTRHPPLRRQSQNLWRESHVPRGADPADPRHCDPHGTSAPRRPRRPLHDAAPNPPADCPQGPPSSAMVESPTKRRLPEFSR